MMESLQQHAASLHTFRWAFRAQPQLLPAGWALLAAIGGCCLMLAAHQVGLLPAHMEHALPPPCGGGLPIPC